MRGNTPSRKPELGRNWRLEVGITFEWSAQSGPITVTLGQKQLLDGFRMSRPINVKSDYVRELHNKKKEERRTFDIGTAGVPPGGSVATTLVHLTPRLEVATAAMLSLILPRYLPSTPILD